MICIVDNAESLGLLRLFVQNHLGIVPGYIKALSLQIAIVPGIMKKRTPCALTLTALANRSHIISRGLY